MHRILICVVAQHSYPSIHLYLIVYSDAHNNELDVNSRVTVYTYAHSEVKAAFLIV